MKKFFAILLSALLVAAVFAIPVAAVDTWEDGQVQNDSNNDGVLDNWTFSNAYGYVFDIDYVNGTIAGEDGTIITNVDAYKKANPNWAINVLLAPTSEADVYEVVSVVGAPGDADKGLAAGMNFDNGNIVMIIHSSASHNEDKNEDGTDKYANWQQKVAAMALKAGDKVTLDGIDLEAGTVDNGTVTVEIPAPEAQTFWVTHYNDSASEGAGAIFTSAYTGAGWWYHVAFAPVDGTDAYEVVATANGLADGSATPLEIPEGGFVWAANYGNDYPSINNDPNAIDYTNPGVQAAIALAQTWEIGDQFVIDGVDFETVPTSTPDVKWYDDSYVCTATIIEYVPGEDLPAGPIYAEKVVSSYKDYTTSPLFRQDDTYKWNPDSDIAYPDDANAEEMTNGEVAVFQPEWKDFWDVNAPIIGFHGDTPAFEDYAGYAEVGYAWIKVDLGEVFDLNKLSANIHNMDSTSAITKVTFVVSEDGENWTEVGSVDTPDLGDIEAVLELDEAVSAQYVEYRFTAAAYWMFVSEVKAIQIVERNVVSAAVVDVTANEQAAANEDGAVTVWNAGDTDRVITSDVANLRYSWFLVTDAEGSVVKIGNNLVKASENKPDFITEVTVPAGGQLIVFYYNASSAAANQTLMDVYNDILLVANSGAAIFNDVIDVVSDYIVVADEETVAILCTAQSEELPPIVDEPTLEELIILAMGEANEDAQYELEINAPETYKAGDEITVTVTVKNIVREAGIHAVTFNLYYDFEQLVLTNAIDEREKSLICVADEDIPEEWEILTKVNLNEDGTEMLNDGVIYVAANTPYEDTGITEDDELVFTFTFKATEDASTDTGMFIPHYEVTGGANAGNDLLRFNGNGDYAVIKVPVEDPEDPEDPVVPGDASNMIVFAIVAIVAIAGSAVVIKTRR